MAQGTSPQGPCGFPAKRLNRPDVLLVDMPLSARRIATIARTNDFDLLGRAL
jgi:hypothetical protein